MRMKYCNKCERALEDNKFSICKRNKDGLQSACKECNRKHYQNNSETVKEKVNKRYHSNKEREIAKRKIERAKPENKKKKREQDKKWIKENRDYYNIRSRIYCANRRMRLRQIKKEETITGKELACLFEQQALCSYCLKEEKLTVDHVIPISKGGLNTINNIVLVCHSCNSSKQDKNLLHWIVEQNLMQYINERNNSNG